MIMVNQACVTQLGYTREELVGHSVLNLFHPADREAVLEKLQNCLKNRDQVHYWQFRKVTRDGALLWVEEVAQAVYDLNSQVNVLVVCQDVSEQKRLKTEIEEAKRYVEVIVETPIEPLVVLNAEFIILSANHSFYDTFKIPREKTIGTLIYDLGDGQWDIPSLRLLLEQILREHTVFNGYELEHDFLNIGPRTLRLNARRISRKQRSAPHPAGHGRHHGAEAGRGSRQGNGAREVGIS